jgi:IS5 family transposase
VIRSGNKRGITKTLLRMMIRQSAIEPTIGRLKTDGRLGRNSLNGALGGASQPFNVVPAILTFACCCDDAGASFLRA